MYTYPWGQYRYSGNPRNQKKRGHRKQQQDSSAGCRSSVHQPTKGIVSIMDHMRPQKRQASKFSPAVPHAYTLAPRPQPLVPNLWCQSLRAKPHILVLQVPEVPKFCTSGFISSFLMGVLATVGVLPRCFVRDLGVSQ